MKFKVARGDSIFLWFDNRHIDGPLYQKHEHQSKEWFMTLARSCPTLTYDSKWASTPQARSERLVQIQSSLFEIQIYDEDNQ